MDYENACIRKSTGAKLLDLSMNMLTDDGCAKLVKQIKPMFNKGMSRPAIARQFGLFAARTKSETKLLRQLYALAGKELVYESVDYHDMTEDPRNFFVMAYWMPFEAACDMFGAEILKNAAARLLPPCACWPHTLLQVAILVENAIGEEFVRRKGLNKEPTESVLLEFGGMIMLLTFVAALKSDMQRASPDYVQWEGMLMAPGVNLHEESGVANAFKMFPTLLTEMGIAHIFTKIQYDVCKQYRHAFESMAYQMQPHVATRAALQKMVFAVAQSGNNMGFASDRTLKWNMDKTVLHQFMALLCNKLATPTAPFSDAELFSFFKMDDLFNNDILQMDDAMTGA